jgi:hypothetical protein
VLRSTVWITQMQCVSESCRLAGDSQPILHRRALVRFVSCPFRFFRSLLDLADVQLPHAELTTITPAEISHPAV